MSQRTSKYPIGLAISKKTGGVSTVRLARDEHERKWVALKIVAAEHSASVGKKSVLSSLAISNSLVSGASRFISEHYREFTFEGPNGHHLCFILPVLGPSPSDLSNGFDSRLRPWLARKVGYEVTKAVATLGVDSTNHSPRN